MDRITLNNYRCFREQQSARLAPLTLLVGDNSTGKTSFLAMIRALWDAANGARGPDFKEEPYDLGSFEDILHNRGPRSRRPRTFEASFDATFYINESVEYGHYTTQAADKYHFTKHMRSSAYKEIEARFEVTFGKSATAPVPTKRHIRFGECWFEEQFRTEYGPELNIGTSKGAWGIIYDTSVLTTLDYDLLHLYSTVHTALSDGESDRFSPTDESPSISSDDIREIEGVIELIPRLPLYLGHRPFASSPVRSKPRRTYDPSGITMDPEGDYAPMYLANLFSQNKQEWRRLKTLLEDFGEISGLFNEISIRQLGSSDSEPFQLQIRKFGGRLKGPRRNLIDVGYGVSQVLPVIIELLRPDARSMFLLQQPEVHLHPSAQAALGNLFCQAAATGMQLVVETHSDHLMDRVRMDVRDGVSDLKPEDVSILYFERDELDVRIHSLGIDSEGNVVGMDADGNHTKTPEGYRRFFMEETRRALWV